MYPSILTYTDQTDTDVAVVCVFRQELDNPRIRNTNKMNLFLEHIFKVFRCILVAPGRPKRSMV